MKSARPDDIPKATHEGTSTFFRVTIHTYQLNNGHQIIHTDDFHKLLEAIGIDAPTKEVGGQR